MKRASIFGFVLALFSFTSGFAQTISTIAGGAILDNQAALATPLVYPSGLALDAAGNLIVLDTGNSLIRRINQTTGVATVIAGQGTRLDDSLGIPAASALTPRPLFAAMDKSGNLFFSDQSNRVRMLSTAGIVSTVAGNGFFGYSGDGGPAIHASLGIPYGLMLDPSGNLYIADCYNSVVRQVDTKGIIRTIAGNNTFGFTGDGGPATQAAFSCPSSVAQDSAGNLYIVDANNNRLRMMNTSGVISTIAGNGFAAFAPDGVVADTTIPLAQPYAVALDSAGNIYLSEFRGRVRKISGTSRILSTVAGSGTLTADGVPGNQAQASAPSQLLLDSGGNVYFADAGRGLVRRVDAVSGIISTLAGTNSVFDGGAGTSAVLSNPVGIAIDPAGNLFFADQNHQRIRKLDPTGRISTVAGTGIPGFSGDGGPATAALLQGPAGAIVGPAGDIFVSDTYNNRVRKIAAGTQIITTVAGTGTIGSAGDGGPAIQAQIYSPAGLAFDAAGNLYIADAGNGLIRKVDTAGKIGTVAGNHTYGYSGDGGPASQASLFVPTGLLFDTSGNLLIADEKAQVIRKVDAKTSIITTFAGMPFVDVNGLFADGYSGDGGPASLARFSAPYAMTLDAAGNLYVADSGNSVVRKINTSGTVSTVAGTYHPVGFGGDGGLATLASMQPTGLVFDAAGNLYLSDSSYSRIRKITPAAVIPVLAVAPATLNFTATQGGPAPPSQTVRVFSMNAAAMNWSAAILETNTGWLTLSASSGAAPDSVTVTVNLAGLNAGTYSATLQFSGLGAASSPQNVAVVLQVSAAAAPLVVLSTQSVQFQAVVGKPNPAPQTLTVSNSGGGTLDFSAAVAAPPASWLSVSPLQGTAPAGLLFTVDAHTLSPGVYTATVIVTQSGGTSAASCNVQLTVSSAAPSFQSSVTALSFNAVEGGSGIPPGSFTVLNAGSGVLSWNLTYSALDGGNWLQVTPNQGSSDAAALGNSALVTVSVNAAGLTAGVYQGLLTIAAAGAVNSPQLVTVSLRVMGAGIKPAPSLQPSGLVFMAHGGAPLQQSVSVFSPSGTLNFSAGASVQSGANWLSVTPASGRIDGSGTLGIQVNPQGLAPGTYYGTVSLSFDNGSLLDVGVVMLVTSGSGINASREGAASLCQPSSILVQASSIANNLNVPVGYPQSLIAQAFDNCGNSLLGATLVATFNSGDPPLTLINLGNGNYSASWTPQRIPTNGQVLLNLLASAPGFTTAKVAFNLAEGGQAVPLISRQGIVNAASYRSLAPLAPGGIVSVFGQILGSSAINAPSTPLPSTLANVRLQMGSLDLPLYYASPGQVNAQIPFETGANTTVSIVAFANGYLTPPEVVTITAGLPGIFTTNGGGTGQAAATNPSGVFVDASSPATAGDVIIAYCTGLGSTTPTVPTGTATPSGLYNVVNTVTASIGGVNAPVQFAGLTPSFVGLYQVNILVPVGVTSGNAVALVLHQAGQDSNQATIAIR